MGSFCFMKAPQVCLITLSLTFLLVSRPYSPLTNHWLIPSLIYLPLDQSEATPSQRRVYHCFWAESLWGVSSGRTVVLEVWPWTSSCGTWELVKKANSLPHSRSTESEASCGPALCVLTSRPGNSYAHQSLRTTGLEDIGVGGTVQVHMVQYLRGE